MAENESLDLSSSPRMRIVYDAFRSGSSCPTVASKLEKALIGGLRKALKEFRERGVKFSDIVQSRDRPQAMRQLLRKVEGHDYARLFAEVAATTGACEKDCVAGWINGVLEKVTDQICHRMVGSEQYPTIESIQTFAAEVREHLSPVVERLTNDFDKAPDSLPRQRPTRGPVPVNPTADLMNFSLLGAERQ